ncbi:MAG: hypothetical protein ACOY45_07445 [Pseudomonadota bacterium]
MYSESDIANAVDAGAISPEAAAAFRDYVATSRSAPAVDEEHFRLLSGFNDIFVAIAATLILVAAARIGALGGFALVPGSFDTPREMGAGMAAGGGAVALVSWLLAEYFTRVRRMSLPSILLLLAFVGGIGAGLSGLFVANAPWIEQQFGPMNDLQHRQLGAATMAVVGALTAGAAWLHWRRFMVPITVAAGAAALVGVTVGTTLALFPETRDAVYPMLLAAGLVVFALAMWWDRSDLERKTRRSDVAFWLHLAAAPLIAHPVFQMLGVFNGDISGATAAIVLALYVGFALVALAVDRRALLVSSLGYVLYAMYTLFNATGDVELSASLTALVIGSALLTLSAFWQPMRRQLVGMLGGIGDHLPPTAPLAHA